MYTSKFALLAVVMLLLACSPNRSQEMETVQEKPQLEIIDMKAGLSYYSEFSPMVIMKLKNISNTDYTKRVYIKAIFVKDDEQVCEKQDMFDGPLPPGISKSISLKCYSYGINPGADADKYKFKAMVYVNDELLKTMVFTADQQYWIEK